MIFSDRIISWSGYTFHDEGQYESENDPDDGSQDHAVSMAPVGQVLNTISGGYGHGDRDEEYTDDEAPGKIALHEAALIFGLAHACGNYPWLLNIFEKMWFGFHYQQ